MSYCPECDFGCSPISEVHPHGWEWSPDIELPVSEGVQIVGAEEDECAYGEEGEDRATAGDDAKDKVPG